MRLKTVAVLCFMLFVISACTVSLRFDGAPPKASNETFLRFRQQNVNFFGVFQLKSINNSANNECFIANDFDRYSPPKLGNSSKDTLDYLVNGLVAPGFIEITCNNNGFHCEYFNAVNERVYRSFFVNKIRRFKIKSDSIVVASEIVKDTLMVHLSDLTKNIKSGKNVDSLIKLKCWRVGELLCFQNNSHSVYSPKILTNIVEQDSVHYCSFYKGNMYIVNRESAAVGGNYLIYRLVLNKEGFQIYGFVENETKDTLSGTDTQSLNSVVHYTENTLGEIINTGVEEKQMNATLIKGFPIFIQDEGSQCWRTVLLSFAVALLLFIIIRTIKRNRKSKN